MVYFWLKSDIDEDKNNFFLSELRQFLIQVPVIDSSSIGKPAGTQRDVVDGSFTYSLMVVFKNAKDHETYQKHEAHKIFIERCSNLWDRVQVYDSVQLIEEK